MPVLNLWGRIKTRDGIILLAYYTLSISVLPFACDARPKKLNFLNNVLVKSILFYSLASFLSVICLLESTARIILLQPSKMLVVKLAISGAKDCVGFLCKLFLLRFISLCKSAVFTVNLELAH